MTTYTIESNTGYAPNQIKGKTDDGKLFYFRGRGGYWELHIASDEEQLFESPVLDGELSQAGYMTEAEWEVFFWDVIRTYEAGLTHPQAAFLEISNLRNKIKALHDYILIQSPRHSIPVQEVVEKIRKEFKEVGYW